MAVHPVSAGEAGQLEDLARLTAGADEQESLWVPADGLRPPDQKGDDARVQEAALAEVDDKPRGPAGRQPTAEEVECVEVELADQPDAFAGEYDGSIWGIADHIATVARSLKGHQKIEALGSSS